MQKCTKILNMLIAELVDDSAVGEVIVIDNSRQGFNYSNNKIKVITPKKNLYVNNAWNLGVKEAKYEYIGILNDDLLIPKNLCKQILEFLKSNTEAGLVGLDSSAIQNTDLSQFDTYPDDKPAEFSPITQTIYTNYWGAAFFGKKENYYEIPKNLKIWCGDNFLLKQNLDRNKTCYELKGITIKHLCSMTCSNPIFDKIKESDVYHYSKIDKQFLNHSHYKKPLSLLQHIFSITNEGQHKVFRVLGFKIKNKYNKKPEETNE